MASNPKPRRRQRRPTTGRASVDPGTRCRGERRHDFDGHVFVETSASTGEKVWAAREECLRCGTERVIFMEPESCEEMSRRYFHPDDYDTSQEPAEAKRTIYRAMLSEAEEGAER